VQSERGSTSFRVILPLQSRVDVAPTSESLKGKPVAS
jgi:hypothetical protein